MADKKGFKECPFCGKEVDEGVVECPYCKRIYRLHVEDKKTEQATDSFSYKKSRTKGLIFFLGAILITACLLYTFFWRQERAKDIQESISIERRDKALLEQKTEIDENVNKNISEKKDSVDIDEEKTNDGINEAGSIQYGEENPDKTLKSNIKITGKERVEAFAHYKKGMSLKQEGKLDLAENEIKASINIDPTIPWAHYGLGIIYISKGLDDEAIKEFERALMLDNRIASAHYQLGKIYQKKDEHDKAINEFLKTIERDSSFFWAHYRLAVLYKKIGKIEESKKEYEIFSSLKEEADEFDE